MNKEEPVGKVWDENFSDICPLGDQYSFNLVEWRRLLEEFPIQGELKSHASSSDSILVKPDKDGGRFF